MLNLCYKPIFLLITLSVLFVSQYFCVYINEKGEAKISNNKPPTTTLDSLQGSWISIDDSLNKVNVSNRLYTEFYADEDSAKNYFRIYFSDTLVDVNLSFTDIRIDTSSVSGKYLITKSIADNTFWCYEFNGFYSDTMGITFSISDTWAKHKPTVFKKQ